MAADPIASGRLLRSDLLAGTVLALAPRDSGSDDELRGEVRRTCSQLGARVCDFVPDPADDDRTAASLRDCVAPARAPDVLVVDGGASFAAAGGGLDGLRACADSCWAAARAAALAMLEHGAGRRLILIAPAPSAGTLAEPARAALENTVRTVSIEWARHALTAVCVAPGDHSRAAEVATLIAFLASPAGGYYSGCLLDLRGA